MVVWRNPTGCVTALVSMFRSLSRSVARSVNKEVQRGKGFGGERTPNIILLYIQATFTCGGAEKNFRVVHQKAQQYDIFARPVVFRRLSFELSTLVFQLCCCCFCNGLVGNQGWSPHLQRETEQKQNEALIGLSFSSQLKTLIKE